MRGGNGYENNERRFLAYRMCYLILHQGYSARNERIRLPDCMTHAIKREWPNPPGEEYTGFNLRRRRRGRPVRLVHPVRLQIQDNHHPQPVKIEKLPTEVIEILDEHFKKTRIITKQQLQQLHNPNNGINQWIRSNLVLGQK
jgi:hypothetical protein